MTRPTPEQLQTAMIVADQSRPPHYVAVLAAEVRALQRELDLFRSAGEAAELRIVELREEVKFATARADDNEATVRRLLATLARVEELPARWRGHESRADLAGAAEAFAFGNAAMELEAALRGDT